MKQLKVGRSFAWIAGAMCAAGLAACGGGNVVLRPIPAHASPVPSSSPRATAKPTATPAASASPAPGATLAPSAVATALAGVQTLYAALPHTSLIGDLDKLATEMVSSGTFKAAVANPGGITGILKDGTTAIVFDDRPEDVTPEAAARSRASSAIGRADLPLSASSPHEIAFLVDETDAKAFTPSRQTAFASAFTARGFTAANGYGVDDLDVTLDNISSLAGRGIDFLDVATHGSVGGLGPLYDYEWLTDTPVTAANSAKYASAIKSGSVVYGTLISLITARYVPKATYAFSPRFLTSTLTFNPGAFVDNQSCFGTNPKIAAAVESTLSGAGVARYLGWTKSVLGDDADGTDAFLIDRLLGEQSPATGLSAYAKQATIPQQPFGLDDVYPVMSSEDRDGPFQSPGPGYSYTASDGGASNAAYPPAADGNVAFFTGKSFTAGAADPPLEYGMPSVLQLRVTENPAGSSMAILGEFPPKPGTVTIVDSGGSHPLAVTSWSATEVDVTLPSAGAGSGGDVEVVSASGIASNTVPLTTWSGTFTANESDTWGYIGAVPGTGSGTIGSTFNVDFRADVHPFIPTPDASPVAQNLAFQNVENDSTATVTSITGRFDSESADVNGTKMPLTVTYSLSPDAAVMPVSLRPLIAPSFGMGAVFGQPGTCNDGSAGTTSAGSSNVFCPGIGYRSLGAAYCTDNQDGLGCESDTDPTGGFSDGSAGDGLLVLTMNPATYTIAVTSTAASTVSSNFVSTTPHTGSGDVAGTIGAPVDPPTVTTPVTTAVKPRGRPVHANVKRAPSVTRRSQHG